KYYQDSYNLPDEWFAGALDDSVTYADSVYSAQLDILVPDIRGISPGVKVLVFDECFNGAFIYDSYVAGEYIFGSGNSVVGIANTVNVKQDIWLSEMIGLLNYGVRVGNWHRNFNFIESHIIGDPTYHFSGSGKTDLNRALTVDAGKLSLWKKMLRSADVPLQVLAINRLTELSGEAFADDLVDIYHANPSFTVRMSVLLALAQLNTPEFHSLLTESIKDPYELIRRISTVWMAEIGSDAYLPLLAEAAVSDNGKRVSFQAKNALQTLNPAAAAVAVDQYQATLPGPEMAYTYDYRGALERTVANLEEDFAVISDTTTIASKRISKIRTFRNYKYHNSLPALFELAADNSEDIAVRTVIIEALGWYHYSWQRPAIEKVCQSIVADSAVPEAVRLEAVKTLARLDQGCNNPLAP
ncbi:MAG: HEAT repeat domain-containing protein, partial [Candidatus Neomarinimicrobiota bacterium]